MESPYRPPSSPEAPVPGRPGKRRFWKWMIWGSIVMTVVPPLNAIAGVVAGMTGAFQELAEAGSADPEKLAGRISVALLSTLYGCLFAVPGLVLLILSILRFRANAPRPANPR